MWSDTVGYLLKAPGRSGAGEFQGARSETLQGQVRLDLSVLSSDRSEKLRKV